MPKEHIAGGVIALMVWSAFTAAGCGRSSTPAAAQTSSRQSSGVQAALSATAAPTVGQSPQPAPLDQAAIDAIQSAGQKMLAAAAAPDLDVDRKAAELGPDINRLFAFVRNDIRQHVYPGVLRGARGTLTGRAGNAWDKAGLLAALLRHHGREVRFARGRLTPDRAAAVVDRMFADARRPRDRAGLDPPQPLVARSRGLIAGVEARWRSTQSDLDRALTASGIALGSSAPVPDAALAAEAADHAWIEYRDGEQWIPLDPTLGERVGEAATNAVETFAQIPDAVQHRITFRVKLEQRKGQTLEERDAFVWRSTAAALHGASLLLTHRFDRTSLGQWRATPVLALDGRAYAARSFTAAGLVESKPSDALVGEASRQVQGVGGINELFGGAAPAQPTRALSDWTAERLEVEFTDPSGHTETVRREIADRIDPVARARGEAALAPLAPIRVVAGIPLLLTGLYGGAITAGPLDPRLLCAPLVSVFAARSDAVALQNVSERDTAKLIADDRARARRVVAAVPPILEAAAQLVHALSQSLARRFVATDGAVVFYEATPRLALVSLEPSGYTMAVDLRRNALRVVARGVSGKDLVRANFARGVMDGVIEDAIVAPQPDTRGARPLSAVAALEIAHAQNIPVAASPSIDAARANPSEAARARIRASAGQPIVIVAPARGLSIAGSTRMAWWAIDTTTGETLGVLDSGLHGAQSMGEYLDLLEREMVMELGPGWIETSGPSVDAVADTMPLAQLGKTAQATGDLVYEFWMSGLL